MEKEPITVSIDHEKELMRLKILKDQKLLPMAEARAHGDLKENAEYHAAKSTSSN